MGPLSWTKPTSQAVSNAFQSISNTSRHWRHWLQVPGNYLIYYTSPSLCFQPEYHWSNHWQTLVTLTVLLSPCHNKKPGRHFQPAVSFSRGQLQYHVINPHWLKPIHMDADMGRGFKSVSPKQSSITFRPWCGLCVACSTWMVSGQCISWSFVWAASRLTLMKKFIDWTGPRQSVDAKMIKASNVHTSYLYHIDHK